jgi:hypothetical protein
MKLIGYVWLGALAGALGCAGPGPHESSSEPVTTVPATPLEEPVAPASAVPPPGTCAGVGARCETAACCSALGCFDGELVPCQPDSSTPCACWVLLG